MKSKLLFGTGLAAGYVLGSRSGRAAYEKLKSQAASFWQSKPVQDKVAAASEAVKEKAPEVSSQLTEAARRAGTVISSAVQRGGSHSSADTPSDESGSAIPAHSTHPGTANLGTTGGAHAATVDVDSDPALNDATGRDWSDEGGATPSGPATNVDPDKR
ncbi:hypothetical protein [Arthrobacter sp. Soil763]|uniref:hypothetical protein n=1 Tax=Arthrobacter sp. Soil763 TaxID=1736402 RepID=UPI0006FA582F|nr:hypothetical protein [Arthrobacter sp. Soil763]KRE81818.1 hypothetical protein ASG71_01790 [Arthrobacter sp. Soil763]